MNHESRVAIFIDAENLTHWVKQGGVDALLEDLSAIGAVVVRKAYARWTNPSMGVHQAALNRHGFELIHTFHPVSGKNSADIQITVDVMEYAWRDDLACIALATGDSDFSPLFRRLREMGKQVVGIGPRSALSESVKSSCSRFFYTQTETASHAQDESSHASAFDDAADLLESALKTFDGPANCSPLKNRMLNIDSAFDEKSLGFKSFTAFIKAVDGIELVQDGQTWSAFFQDNDSGPPLIPRKIEAAGNDQTEIDLTELYRRTLRKMHWRPIPASVLTQCYANMHDIGAVPKSELVETVSAHCDNAVTTAEVKKAVSLLMKAGLMARSSTNDDGELTWQISPIPRTEMLEAVDQAMVVRLTAGLNGTSSRLEREHLAPLFLGHHNDSEIEQLIKEAKRRAHIGGGQD